MKTIPLGEILTDEQIERVLDIIQNTPQRGRITKLKEYLGQFKQELEDKGVVADYLCYVIEHLITKQPKETNERN